MKLLINGIMGRMGSAIAKTVLTSSDFQLIGGVDREKGLFADKYPVDPDGSELLGEADLVVDFSTAPGTEIICRGCIENGKPLITGTTALTEEQFKLLKELSRTCPVIQSYNFSVGINLMLKLVSAAAATLRENYDIEIVETHHRDKKDAPSGTAILLSETISKTLGEDPVAHRNVGREGTGLHRDNNIFIHSLRGGSVPGEHQVHFLGKNETISITHQALSRQVFVDGVLRAGRWIANRQPGLYSMQDVLNLK